MTKAALLIGVSEYEAGFPPLPAARADAEIMSRVLKDPEVGGFDPVTVLIDPSRQEMEEAIYALFSSRQKDDLALLYFSGHGVTSENGTLYLTTRNTRREPQGAIVSPTAVSARFIQDVMSNSRSRRQVIILDCSFSGAFARDIFSVAVKGDSNIDIAEQLGGSGRAILTSSTSTQYSFEQEESDLSIFTRYLVEGIATGAADQNIDGLITVDELYEYARHKIREAAPAMGPKMYVFGEGYSIILARAPVGDSAVVYRNEVTNLVESGQGKLSPISGRRLSFLRTKLGISVEKAKQIEAEVLQPYREFQSRLQEYEQALVEVIKLGYPIDDKTSSDLEDFRQFLALREEDIREIQARVAAELSIPTQLTSSTVETSHDDLSSERGLDYTRLRDLLKSQNWKEADYETYRLILKQVGRREGDSIREEEIKQFPCADLRTLDQLWVKYSNGIFGFSVQKQIYLACGGKLDGIYDENIYRKFGDRIGWRSKDIWIPYYDLIFDLSAPLGHLPRPGGWVKAASNLFSRLEACRL